MRILAVDVGTGTQDILLFDSSQAVENAVQLVMPSPTMLVAGRVRAATHQRQPLVLTGVTMGGGPSAWAVEDHLRAGLPVAATLPAAQSFDDDPAGIERMGIRVVEPDEADALPGTHVEMRDFYERPILDALTAFGVEPRLDAIAVAVFDHGAAPPGESDRIFRFRHLAETLRRENDLTAFAYARDKIPPSMTRLAAVASTVSCEQPLVVMDTGPAAAVGALEDPRVRQSSPRVVVNVGNFHTLCFLMEDDRVVGLFEHHTGEVTPAQLVGYVDSLVAGELTNDQVYDEKGHGAIVWPRYGGAPELYAVIGPRRAMLRDTALRPYFAVPHGAMMLAGCFGLLRACAARLPDYTEQIAAALAADARGQTPW